MDQTVRIKILLSSLIAPPLAFFQPINMLILPILWLVLLDILTGMYATRVVEKKALTSRGFLQKLPQILMFFVAIAAALHADPFFTEFGVEKFQSAKLVISFYGLYETFSVLENLGRSGLPVARQFARILQAKLPDEVKAELSKDESKGP